MFHSGQHVGPYTLVRELGRGSFGVVWLAEDRTQTPTGKVAAKLPLPDAVDLDEFWKEVKVWVNAGGHPNVLPILTAGIFSGQLLIASQYVPDGTLTLWLRKNGGRAPSVDSAIRIVAGILNGLKHLHAKDIVHRDLKPGNVLLQAGEPLIADFGLARVLRLDSSTFRLAGTPAYMSPEVWENNDRCFQADLWAVGVILYELLSGVRPFAGSDRNELERAIRDDAFVPLPAEVPEVIRTVIDRALQKDKRNRYQTAEHMLQNLGPIEQGFTTLPPAIPETVPQQTVEYVPRQTIDFPREELVIRIHYFSPYDKATASANAPVLTRIKKAATAIKRKLDSLGYVAQLDTMYFENDSEYHWHDVHPEWLSEIQELVNSEVEQVLGIKPRWQRNPHQVARSVYMKLGSDLLERD